MRTTRLFLIVLLCLVYAPIMGAEEEAPRRHDGKPDLSGTYDIKWLTPFTRNPKYGESPYMTDEEAQDIASSAADGYEHDIAPIDGDRPAPPTGGDGHPSNIGGHNRFWWDRGSGAFKVDGKYRNSVITNPSNGQLPPLSDQGRAMQARTLGIYNKNPGDAWWLEADDDLYDHPEYQTHTTRCLYSGGATVPMQPTTYNNVKTITQTDTHVTILVEWQHWARVIRLTANGRPAEHLPAEMISWGGDSIGWWEGDTLVVDTTNFKRASVPHKPEAAAYSKEGSALVRSPGQPHEGRHVVERFTRIDKDTLMYEFEVEDPDRTAAYGGSLPFPRTDQRLFEYACHEGNYSMGGMLRGARQLEKEYYENKGR